MNIIIDATTTQDEFKKNGVGWYTKPLIENLIKGFPDTKFKLLMFDSSSTLDPFLGNKHENVERVCIGKLRSNNYLNPLWLRLYFLPKIKQIMDKESVYFTPYFWRGFPVHLLPTVVTIHDFAFARFNIYSQQSFIHNLIRKSEYWYDMRRTIKVDAIITDAQFTKQDYLSFFPKYPESKIFPIYLGIDMELKEVDIDKYLPSDWREKGYYIYLGGGFTKNKNTEGIILSYSKLVSMLKKENKSIPYLVITGKNFTDKNNANLQRLFQMIKDEGLDGKVIFTGYYEDIERYSFLKNSIAALHLSFYEGFGFSLVEGMLAGTPSIAHNGSCYPEIVKDGGVLVDGRNYEEVANVMLKILEDKAFARKIAYKGKQVAKEYRWDITAQKTYEVFKKVLESSRI